MSGGNAFLTLLEKIAPGGTPAWLLALAAAGVGVALLIAIVSVIAMSSVWTARNI
jgi:hypothetical protein